MKRHSFALMGSALAALLCTAGVAKAQDYYDRYGRVYDNGTETVIVHPDYDDIEKRSCWGGSMARSIPRSIRSPARELLRPGSYQR